MLVSVTERTREIRAPDGHPAQNSGNIMEQVPHRSGAHLRRSAGCSGIVVSLPHRRWSSICSSPTSPCFLFPPDSMLAGAGSARRPIGIVYGFMPARNAPASTLSTRFRGNDGYGPTICSPACSSSGSAAEPHLPDGQPGKRICFGARTFSPPATALNHGHGRKGLPRRGSGRIVALALERNVDLA